MALVPLRIALIYALAGALWILFSDKLLLSLATDPLTLTLLQTFKGWFFVAVTAALLYGIIRSGLSGIRRTEKALLEKERLLSEAQQIAQIGSWTYDITGRIIWSDETYRIYGVSPDTYTPDPESFLNLIHTDDQAAMQAWINACLAGEKPDELEFRSIMPDGTLRFISGRGELKYDPENRAAYLAGTAQDITERRQAEEKLKKSETLLQETQRITKVGGWEYDVKKNRLRWTDEVYRIHDLSPDTYDPNNIQQNFGFYAPHDKQTIEQAFYKAVQEGEPYDLELQFITAKGRHLWVRTVGKPVREGDNIARVVGNIIDITEQKKAGEMILRLTRLYSVLSKTNEAIVRAHEPEELYGQVCIIAVEDGLFRMAWIGLVDTETLFIKPVAVSGHEDGYLRGMRISIDEKIPEGRGPTGRAVREGGYCLCNDIENDAAMAPWRDEALKRGYRSSAAFALKEGRHIVGTLNIYAGVPYYFQEEGEELLLLQTLAADISYALEAMAADKKRGQAEESLRSLAAELEQRVMERTAKLEEKIAEIERMNKLFVGRELRMKELKEKIKELEGQAARGEGEGKK